MVGGKERIVVRKNAEELGGKGALVIDQRVVDRRGIRLRRVDRRRIKIEIELGIIRNICVVGGDG